MKQLVIRIDDTKDDAEILESNEYDEEVFTSISKSKLLNILNTEFRQADEKEDYTFVPDGLIACSANSYVIRQPEHKRIVIYEGIGYKITFPNSIYIILTSGNRIQKIKAFAYKEYKGIETELFRYPMPNMLSGNAICMGSAKREIENRNVLNALENIIYAEYTHSTFDDLKSFRNTQEYFEYLLDNPFPYDLMIPVNYTLGKELDIHE